MARGAQPVSGSVRAGTAVAVVILGLTLGTLAAVFARSEGISALGPADWAAVRFTVLQAALSALLSCLLAVPVARALARRRFPGRGVLVTLLGAPFILPVIVAVLGLLAVFGRSGLVSDALGAFGMGPLNIYGLTGVVLAHVFFNLPLATRLILQGWLSIPAERFRLAASLDFHTGEVARVLERPMLREVLPGALVVIFVICTTSFAVALTLGGGPKATTVELAIYQAFRFEFDLGRAALLATLQFAISALAAVAVLWVAVPGMTGGGLDRVVQRWDARGRLHRAMDAGWLLAVALFLLLPLAMVVLRGLAGLADLPAPVLWAAGRSVLVALGSALLMLALALPLSLAVVRLGRGLPARLLEGVGTLAIAASPLVIGTGLFLLLFPVADPAALALPVTALVNAVMSLPFALRALIPALRGIEAGYGRLCAALDMSGWQRLRLVVLPRLRGPLGFATGLSAALSMGDLGVIALFADPGEATLPLEMYRLMSAYRMEQAAGAALLLLLLSLGVFYLFDRGGRVNADA